MSAYVIAQIDVTDPDVFEQYRKQVPATLEAHGGAYIVRGGAMEVLEGEQRYPRIVVIKFDSMQAAKDWHGSAMYEGPKALRMAASKGNLIVVEGLE